MIEQAISEVIKVSIISLFVYIVIAVPSFIAKKIDSLLFNEPEEPPIRIIDPKLIMPMNPTQDDITSELKILELLDRARDNAKSLQAKQVWEIKKAEYIRELRWRQLKESAYGTDKVS